MSKNRSIRILNASGSTRTNPKAAVQMIARGQARYVDDGTIEIISRSPIANSEGETRSRPHSPQLDRIVVEFRSDAFTGQTFLHYPQPGSFRKAA